MGRGFGGGLGWRGGGSGLMAQLQMLYWEFGVWCGAGVHIKIGVMRGSCC